MNFNVKSEIVESDEWLRRPEPASYENELIRDRLSEFKYAATNKLLLQQQLVNSHLSSIYLLSFTMKIEVLFLFNDNFNKKILQKSMVASS